MEMQDQSVGEEKNAWSGSKLLWIGSTVGVVALGLLVYVLANIDGILNTGLGSYALHVGSGILLLAAALNLVVLSELRNNGNSLHVAREKLTTEIIAGCAVILLFANLYQGGLEIDRFNVASVTASLNKWVGQLLLMLFAALAVSRKLALAYFEYSRENKKEKTAKVEKEKAEKEQAEKERAEKAKAEKEKAESESRALEVGGEEVSAPATAAIANPAPGIV